MEWTETDYYFHNGTKEQRWEAITLCCSNLAKKLLQGVSLDDDLFHDRLYDAIVECMMRLEDRGEPVKLSSYCYWPVYRSFKGSKAERQDKERKNWLSFKEVNYEQQSYENG